MDTSTVRFLKTVHLLNPLFSILSDTLDSLDSIFFKKIKKERGDKNTRIF